LPTELSIASTDRCNLRCVMCGTHHPQTGDNNAGRDDLNGALVEKIEPLALGAESIQLHGGGGEPLFNPEFWKLVAGFSAVPGRNIEIHTNGLLFTARNISTLINSAITHVSISFDAAGEALFRKIRGGDFQRLIRNVINLVEARRQSGRTDLRLSANMTVFQANVHEAPALVELAHGLGLDAVMLMHLNGGEAYNWTETKADGWTFDYRANLPDANPQYIRKWVDETMTAAAARDLELIVDPRLRALGPGPQGVDLQPETMPIAAERTPQYRDCRTPWRWLNIAANGDVYPCCWAAHPLGNLNRVESLGKIWNGRKIRELRNNIRENRLDRDICDGASCLYVTCGKAGT
jgi:radical SAM protein with 4Fe4S-binding SPASM domain